MPSFSPFIQLLFLFIEPFSLYQYFYGGLNLDTTGSGRNWTEGCSNVGFGLCMFDIEGWQINKHFAVLGKCKIIPFFIR